MIRRDRKRKCETYRKKERQKKRKERKNMKTHRPDGCCCLDMDATAAARAAGFRPPPVAGSPDRTAYTSYAEARRGSWTGSPEQTTFMKW
jgi:hypothetical protein